MLGGLLVTKHWQRVLACKPYPGESCKGKRADLSSLGRGTLAAAMGPSAGDPLKVAQQALPYRLCAVAVPPKWLQAGQLPPISHILFVFPPICMHQSSMALCLTSLLIKKDDE